MKNVIVFAALSLLLSVPKAEAREGMFAGIKSLQYAARTGILQGSVAKELCSCRYVSGLSLKDCKAMVALPPEAIDKVAINDQPKSFAVAVQPNSVLVPGQTKVALAQLDYKNPRKGCRLIDPQDVSPR